jgi:lipopolysaccharide transport system permease protein
VADIIRRILDGLVSRQDFASIIATGPEQVVRRSQIIYYRDLIWVLVAKELKLRYKNTVLGYVWSVLNPLVFAMVFFVMFKVIMRLSVENYALFLITGLFPWQWFSNSVTASNNFFLGNSSLIKRVKFPRYFLVLAGVLNDLIHFALSILVIVIFMLVYHKHPSLSWVLLLPFLVVVQFLLTMGIALMVSTCNLFFRDMERLTGILVMIWFYVTPVLFPLNMIPPRFQWTIFANPMGSLVICWRSLFLGVPLSPFHLAQAAAWAALIFVTGFGIYRSLEWRFAEIV